MSLTIKEINELLASTRDKKYRKRTDAQLVGYAKNSQSNKEFRKNNPWSDEKRKQVGNKLRGKTLEDLIGTERAEQGRQRRREAASHPRDKKTVNKILETKLKRGVYDSPTHGMRGKEHSEETKIKQGQKAKVRQELKRKLGLGKADKVPKDLLEAEYKRLKL